MFGDRLFWQLFFAVSFFLRAAKWAAASKNFSRISPDLRHKKAVRTFVSNRFFRKLYPRLEVEEAFLLNENRSDHQAHNCHRIDQNVHRRAGGVFERISDGVSNDTGFVRAGSFSTVISELDIFFCIVPSTACIGHEKSESNATQESADEKAAQSFRSESEADSDWHRDREAGGKHHFLQGRTCSDVDTACGVRLCRSFENPRDFAELAANFLDHIVGSCADSIHRDRAIEEGGHSTDENSDRSEEHTS